MSLEQRKIKKMEIDHAVGVPVEAEIGELARLDDAGNLTGSSNSAQPDDVRRYLSLCQPDSLAIGIGNAHGFYNGPVKLHLDVLQACRSFTDIPFVLHGCTGMDEQQVRRSLEFGVAKINFGTQIRTQYVEYLREGLAQKIDQGHEIFRSPAILQGADLANGFMGGRTDFMNATLEDKRRGALNIGEAVKRFAAQSTIPVALHLDHGRDFDSVKAAIAGGYTSVMIDGSSLPFEQNIELTREVVKYAHDGDPNRTGPRNSGGRRARCAHRQFLLRATNENTLFFYFYR